jgi:hypothetical protein
MKIQKLLQLVLLVILPVTLLYAAPQMGSDKDSGTKTITGCLHKGVESDGFFLISTQGKHWELYPDNGVSLADHVGHKVTLTGMVAHRSADEEKVSQPNEKQEMQGRKHGDLHVSNVKMVSESCQ